MNIRLSKQHAYLVTGAVHSIAHVPRWVIVLAAVLAASLCVNCVCFVWVVGQNESLAKKSLPLSGQGQEQGVPDNYGTLHSESGAGL